jgi:hypothetical protein
MGSRERAGQCRKMRFRGVRIGPKRAKSDEYGPECVTGGVVGSSGPRPVGKCAWLHPLWWSTINPEARGRCGPVEDWISAGAERWKRAGHVTRVAFGHVPHVPTRQPGQMSLGFDRRFAIFRRMRVHSAQEWMGVGRGAGSDNPQRVSPKTLQVNVISVLARRSGAAGLRDRRRRQRDDRRRPGGSRPPSLPRAESIKTEQSPAFVSVLLPGAPGKGGPLTVASQCSAE